MSDIAARKREHIAALNRDAEIERHASGFDRIHLTHRALPELNLDEVDTGVTFLGKPLSFPLLISSMTGGDGDMIRTTNRHLAEAAEACGVAMAVGSQRILFSNPSATASFELREYAPSTVLIGNLGAVQLNDGFSAEHCQQAVDVLNADGLYLHLNPLQEAIQPEGDTDFSNLVEKIAAINHALNVPVLLKEVGCGLSVKDIALVFQDWGITTVSALKQASTAHPDVTLIASGGIRSGIDMAKAVILGAELCGIAAPLLKPAMSSTQAVIDAIERLKREYRTALFLLGCANSTALRHHHELIEKAE